MGTLHGYAVVTVNAFGVREVAREDEEFTNFATHLDFPDLIPPDEVWIDRRLFDAEGLFFLANALTHLELRRRGDSDDRAYKVGLDVERLLRERLSGERYRHGRPHRQVPDRVYAGRYQEVPDPVSPVEVRLVEGNVVRNLYRTEYAEGGHGYVYRWVPKEEVWVEKDLDPSELPFIVAHEYTELRLMRDAGLDYHPAHAIASRVEFDLREGDRVKDLVAPGRRKLARADLPRLASSAYFAFVRQHYQARR